MVMMVKKYGLTVLEVLIAEAKSNFQNFE